jgi:structural maintenance of chromosome 1
MTGDLAVVAPATPMNVTAPVAARGRIDRIEVENFKSYKGRHVIGPFKEFTSVIGPNGSGKSNLMDAISFVLGVRSAQLRGTTFKDLIYTSDLSEVGDVRRSARVTLAYVPEGEQEVQFRRVIEGSGATHYEIDGKRLTSEEYNERLKSYGILVKARNFLVYQGDIEAVASKSPKELTTLIEQISGSEEYAESFKESQRAKQRAEEEAHTSFTKKKALMTQKKQMREQKEEAEKHLAMQERVKEMKVESALFKLHYIDKEIERTHSDMKNTQAVKDEFVAGNEKHAKEYDEKRQEKATMQKTMLKLEQKMKKLQNKIDSHAPHTMQIKEEKSRVQKKLELGRTQLTKLKKDAESQSVEIAKMEQHIVGIDQAEALFDAEQKRRAAEHSKFDLSAEQLAEYNAKKIESGTATFKLKTERDQLMSQLGTDEESAARLSGKVSELESRLSFLQEQEDREADRLATMKETAKTNATTLKELEKKIKELNEERRTVRSRQDLFKQKIEALNTKLRDAKADRKQNERETRALEAIAAMKRLFTGVHGRLTELIKVSQKKYELAVITVLGREADAVIVEDAKTAKDCIQYLKEQRIQSMQFIPLKEIKVQGINERLRHLGGSARLVVDVLQFDKAYERAILFACGDTVVCDTHNEAKKLAFGGAQRIKSVSLDGTLVDKSGRLTGGSSSGLAEKANRFSLQDVEKTRQEKFKLEEELSGMKSLTTLMLEEQQCISEKSSIEKDVQFLQADEKVLKDKLAKLGRDKDVIIKSLNQFKPELTTAKKAMKEGQAKVAELDEKIHAIVDKIYASFTKSLNIANIRVYENEHLLRKQKEAEEKSKFASQRSKWREQLNYEKSRDTQSPIKTCESMIRRYETELTELETSASDANQELEEAKAALAEMESEQNVARSSIKAIMGRISLLQEEVGGAAAECARLDKIISSSQNAMDALREVRGGIISSAFMEQIDLPRVLALGGGEADAMEVDGDGKDDTANTDIVIDYSNLRSELKHVEKSDRDGTENRLRIAIDELTLELSRLEPNMKALEQYETVKEKERLQTIELEAARDKVKEASEAFENVRNRRRSTFMDAFQHIAESIDVLYKELTRSASHPLGGQAYLSLENVEDPFLHGVNFTAMPPSKRFREMDQLSGGEKTIAAVALLFSIHSYRSSPFFVLDEVDAALDKVNVEKLAQFMAERSHGKNGKHGVQSIVISLKDYFYDKADALVGVTRDVAQACSKVLTFDLNAYD